MPFLDYGGRRAEFAIANTVYAGQHGNRRTRGNFEACTSIATGLDRGKLAPLAAGCTVEARQELVSVCLL